MSNKTMFIINVAVTCVTCALIIVSCGGCTPEQAQKVNDAIGVTSTAIHTAQPIMAAQPWYVFVLLAADIATSIAAAWLAYKKQKQ